MPKIDERKRINITNIGIDPVDVWEAASRVATIVRARLDMPGSSPVARGDIDGSGATANSSGNLFDGESAYAAAYVCTPNAEHMMDAQKDALFMRILNDAAIVVPDGAGVVLAARLLGYGRISRAPGFDLAKKLVTNPTEYPFSFYFLGGKPGIAEKAAANITNENPNTRIAGYCDGFFTEADEPDIIEAINNSKADILYVALGAPKAEKWIYKNRFKLQVSVCIGVGGTLDTFAGETRLAPSFFRAHGLEWLYRLAREPWRAKRMLKLPRYVIYTIWWRLTGRPGISQ